MTLNMSFDLRRRELLRRELATILGHGENAKTIATSQAERVLGDAVVKLARINLALLERIDQLEGSSRP